MRVSTALLRSLGSGSRALVVIVGLMFAARSATWAVCVGDCDDTGVITVDELVLGVSIALGSQAPSTCPAFLDAEGQVDISQLLKGVKNSLQGCPAEPTATSTGNAATPTDTAAPGATATNTPLATATGTVSATASATATAMSPTSTPTGELPGTATPTDTAPTNPTATASPPATATITATAVATAAATDTAAPPATPTATEAVTATTTTTPTESPTNTATPSTTATPFPVGANVAGRAALISEGLEGLDALVAAIIMAETNDGSAEALVFDPAGAQSPAFPGAPAICVPCIEQESECFCCPVDGFSTRACAPVAQGLEIALALNACAGLGAKDGTATLGGTITINAGDGTCPFTFSSGMLTVDSLMAVYRDDQMAQTSSVSAALTGTIAPTASGTTCLIGALTLALSGTLTSTLPDGSGVEVTFSGTDVKVEQIVFGPDCLPLAYNLTVSGPVTFSPLPVATGFSVQFTNFLLDQAPMLGFEETELTGNMGSDCFGGGVSVTTINPLTVPVGELCPHSGQLLVSGSGGAMAMISYQDGQVTVAQGGSQTTYPSCVEADLLMCL